MTKASFSRSAKADLLGIGAYTLQTWGLDQAERYIGGLEQCIMMLAANPGLGRSCDWVRPGLYRFEKGRHVVFYRRQEEGIHISRILHLGMLPDNQKFEDETPDL